MQQTVFVGLPTFNRPDGLARTLECLLGQTWSSLRILVSDNCSDDPRVQKTIQEFQRLDPRVSSVRQTANIGAHQNFLSVLNACDSEFFMWASDDDIWEPSFVEENIALLNSNPKAQMAFCTVDNINLDGDFLRRYPGFSRFSSGESRLKDAERFLAEPEIMGKANLIYGLFRSASVRALASDVWVASATPSDWSCDVVFLFAFVARHPIIASDKVLLHKRQNTRKKARLINIVRRVNLLPEDEFDSYLARLKSVAPSGEIATLVEKVMIRRKRWQRAQRSLGPLIRS